MATVIDDRPIGLPSESEATLYEIIDGHRVEKLMGIRQILLANRLAFFINQLALGQRLGFAVVEALFDFGNVGTPQFRPDMAFISEERWPHDRSVPSTNAWPVIPDIAVEVVSPSNSADEIQDKVGTYLRAGVRLVWVVYQKAACVHVFDGSATIRIITLDGEIDGGAVLPGFRLPLLTIFGADVDTA